MKSAAAAVALAIVGGICLNRWLDREPPRVVLARVPDATNSGVAASAGPVPGDHCNRLQTTFIHKPAPEPPETIPGTWPEFRGPRKDNIVRDCPPLADAWPPDGPPVRWRIDLGEGHAGPAIFDSRVYLLDYDEEKNADVLRCLALDSGRELWRRWYEVRIKRNHGISRTVPAVSENYVVTMGPKCHVMCVDRRSGDLKWGLDLALDYGTTVPLWYAAQCPIIRNGKAIIAPAGDVMMMAIDCETGKIEWQTPNPDRWKMSHSSIVPMTLGGQTIMTYAALGGIVGIAGGGENAGESVWKTAQWDRRIVAPCPVLLDDQRILVTAGHGAGTMIIPLEQMEYGFRAGEGTVIDKTVFASEQQTPILYDRHLFAILPKDAADRRQELVCFHPDSGIVWHSGKEHRFGLGPYIVADRKLLVLDDNGTLTMVAADTREFRMLAQARVLEGPDAWGPLAMVNGLLLARDANQMVCLDLKSTQ